MDRMKASAEFEKGRDGGVQVTVVRADGSRTSQRKAGKQASALVHRDLGHWVVEKALRLSRGFYGLVASGMDLATFAAPEANGVRLPDEAVAVDVVLGMIDTLRAGRAQWTSEEIHGYLVQACAQRGVRPLPPLTEAQLRELGRCIDELVAEWTRWPEGEVFRLPLEW